MRKYVMVGFCFLVLFGLGFSAQSKDSKGTTAATPVQSGGGEARTEATTAPQPARHSVKPTDAMATPRPFDDGGDPTDAMSAPQLINYQGRLTDGSGNPLTGTYSLSFGIYAVATGGSSVWSETQTGVTVTNGLFNVMLGSVTPVSNLPDGPDCYLEVTVGTTVIAPRIRLVSVPYTLKAQDADKLDGEQAAAFEHTVNKDAASGYAGLNASAKLGLGTVEQGGATGGQVLKWNGSQWAPASDMGGGDTSYWADNGTYISAKQNSGVRAYAAGQRYGIYGLSTMEEGSGIFGRAPDGTGVFGSGLTGVYGAGSSQGILGYCPSGKGVFGMGGSGYGVYGYNMSSSYGVYGQGYYGGVYAYSASGTGVVGEGYYEGVRGHSTNGYGVSGRNDTNNYGVYGQGYYGGVYAYSASGTGVYGYSPDGIGVYGQGYLHGAYFYSPNGYGVSGTGVYGGVYGTGTQYGVRGLALDNLGYGVYGGGYGAGVYGYSYLGNAIIGYSPTGAYGVFGVGHNAGMYGYSQVGYGVYGASPDSSYGVLGTGHAGGVIGLGNEYGVTGYSGSSGYGVYGMGGYGVYGCGSLYGSTGVTGYSDGDLGYGLVGECPGSVGRGLYAHGGDYGAFITNDTVWTLIAHNRDGIYTNGAIRTTLYGMTMYSPDAPEVLSEDMGSAQLASGYCRVDLDPLLLQGCTVSDKHPLRVYVTMNDRCGTFRVEKHGSYFEVFENDGRSNARFDWRIVASRKGYEDKRLEPFEPTGAMPPFVPTASGR